MSTLGSITSRNQPMRRLLSFPRSLCPISQQVPRTHTFTRAISSASEAQDKQKDWSANQYLKFNAERTRPAYDLITQIKPHIHSPSPRIYDLGCGPGNSTSALLSTFPSAKITGLDSSPDMIRKAKSTLPDLEFLHADISSFTPDNGTHLIFSNAVFHWLRSTSRIPTLVRLFQALEPGGVLAIQVPDTFSEPSHVAMRSVAAMQSQPWSRFFAETRVGRAKEELRPEIDRIEAPREFYDALVPFAARVDVWRTKYNHVLSGVHAIVEWVEGTGLRPFLDLIEEEEAREAYLTRYRERLGGKYVRLRDGKVMLAYPRLFVVAVRR